MLILQTSQFEKKCESHVSNKCCENNVMEKLSDSHYVNYQERMSLLPLGVYTSNKLIVE